MITSLTSTPCNAAPAAVAFVPPPVWSQYRGAWASGTTYQMNDVVYYAYSSWISIAAPNLGVTPPSFPTTANAAWQLVAYGADPTALNTATASAQASAATATAQASAASTSASNAATSATAAASSASAAAGSATASASNAAATTAALRSLNASWLGSKTSDPTADNNGNPLAIGAEYLNTTASPNKIRIYTSSGWQDYDAAAQTDVTNANAAAAAAAGSASAASSSASAAAGSASSASTSATNAGNSASAAAGSASSASTSATNAGTSASAAAGSASSASTSATNAGNSASAAASSASSATTSATNAANSATAAANSVANTAQVNQANYWTAAQTLKYADARIFLQNTGDSGSSCFVGNTFATGYLGLATGVNAVADSRGGQMAANSVRMNLAWTLSGAVGSVINTGWVQSPNFRNMLDDGAGNGSVAGSFSIGTPPAAGDNSTKAPTTSWVQSLVATATARAPRRQTVQTGPASSGAPTFLPATSSSLTIAAQGIAAATPLVVAAANGFNASGAVDVVTALTANPSWTLTASTTSYLFVNAATGGLAVSNLPPIYQFGGAISTASSQFTFDYQAMIGYMGNGSAAVATPLVCVGEAVTNASTVTSTTPYTFCGYYDSGFTQTLPGANVVVSKNANMGVQPQVVRVICECTAADYGYNVGDQVSVGYSGYNGSFLVPAPIWSSRNTVGFTTSSNATAFGFGNKGGASSNGPTPGNWKYKLIAERGW